MKLLHTSDWHVGRRIRGLSRAEEHREVLGEIAGIAAEQGVDVVVVAGDLFDVSSPSPEDESVVYRGLLDLAEVAPVLVVAGNHDSPGRLDAVRPLLDLGRVTVVGAVRPPGEGGVVDLPNLGLRVAMLPFVSQRGIVRVDDLMRLDPDQHAQSYEDRVKRVIEALTADMGTDTVNVVAAHLTVYGAGAGGGERESHIFGYAIPPQAFPGHLSYVALGHLHRLQRVAAPVPVWYSGSPLQLDFGETEDRKGVLVVEAVAGQPAEVTPVPLRSGSRLIQIAGTLEQVLAIGAELDGAYVKVVLDEAPRSGLNEEVREAIPGAVEVVLRSSGAEQPRDRERRLGRSPAELFSAYLESKGVDDPDLVALFRDLEEEVIAG